MVALPCLKMVDFDFLTYSLLEVTFCLIKKLDADVITYPFYAYGDISSF